LAFTLTKSPLAIAGVTAVNKAFAAIAALPAGVVADRVERRTVMVASDVTAGAVMLALVVVMTAGRASLAMVYVAAAVLAVCDVSYTLAMQAAFPDVVAADQLATANGRLMAVEGAGESFLGPGCGGFLFALAQRLPFLVDGASFFVSALLVKVTVPLRSSQGTHLDRGAADAPGDVGGTDAHRWGAQRAPRTAGAERYQGRHQRRVSWTDDLRQGFRLFQREASLKLLGAAVASVTFSQGMVIALLVVYGKVTLHLSSTGYGVFLALASLFGVVGAFSAGALLRRFGGSRLIVGGAALVGVSYLGLAFTRIAVVAVFVFGLQEFGAAVASVGSVTARQRIIPRRLYGRIGSVHRLAVSAAAPLGALLAGVIASAAGVRDAVFAAGVFEIVMLALLAPALTRALAAAPSMPEPGSS
jgi:MFS family permease